MLSPVSSCRRDWRSAPASATRSRFQVARPAGRSRSAGSRQSGSAIVASVGLLFKGFLALRTLYHFPRLDGNCKLSNAQGSRLARTLALPFDHDKRGRWGYGVGEKAVFLMRRMSAGSSFVNAKHLAPRSLSDAPMRYSSLSSMMRKRSLFNVANVEVLPIPLLPVPNFPIMTPHLLEIGIGS